MPSAGYGSAVMVRSAVGLRVYRLELELRGAGCRRPEAELPLVLGKHAKQSNRRFGWLDPDP